MPGDVERLISDDCSYEVAGAEYIDTGWDGKIRLYRRRDRTFPTGLMAQVMQALTDRGFTPELVSPPVPTTRPLRYAWSGPDLRPYQREAVDAMLSHRMGVLAMATGGGKTLVAGRMICELDMRSVFLVHTLDLLEQARSALGAFLGPERVGQVGGGTVDPRDVTVATVQTLARVRGFDVRVLDDDLVEDGTDLGSSERALAELLGAGCVVHDECHRVAAPTVTATMECFDEAWHRYGLSASPWRDDGATIAISASLGDVRWSIGASELYRMGYLVQPFIRILPVPPMLELGRARYDGVYSRYVVDNDQRNAMIVQHASRMLDAGRSVLVLVRHVRHGLILQRLIGDAVGYWPVFLSGSDTGASRLEAMEAMRSGDQTLLIATSIADEGLDLPRLSGLVLAGSGKSTVKALQRVGRVLRIHEDKADAEVVDFDDAAPYLCMHSARRRQMYGVEPEWRLLDF